MYVANPNFTGTATFNRTLLELKYDFDLIFTGHFYPFNRTLLELKFTKAMVAAGTIEAFNRTLLELKYCGCGQRKSK